MRLDRLRLRNIGPHRELGVEFGPGINGIIGSNGSGKSTILDAVTMAITNESRQPGGRADNVTWGERRGTISLDFTHGDGRYTIERGLGSRPGQRLLTPEAEYTKAADIQQQLELLLGTTMQALLDNVFIPQKRIEAVFSDQRGVRLREIQRSVGLARAQKAWEALGEEISPGQLTVGLEEQLTSVRGSLDNAEAEELALRDRLSEIDTEIRDLLPARVLVQKAEDRRRTSSAIQQAEKEASEAAAELKQASEDLERAQSEHQAAQNMADERRARAKSAQESLLRYQADRRAHEQAVRLRQELESVDRELGSLEEPDRGRLQAVTERGGKIQALLKTRHEQLEGRVPRPQAPTEAELRRRLQDLETRWINHRDTPSEEELGLRTSAREAEERLRALDEGECPTCGQTVTREMVEATRAQAAELNQAYLAAKCRREEEFTRAHTALDNQLAAARSELQQIEQAAQAAIRRSIEKLDAEQESLRGEWTRLNAQVRRWDELTARSHALRDQLPDVGDEPESVDEQELQALVQQFERIMLRVQELKTQVQLYEQSVAQARERASRARDSLNSLSVGDDQIDDEMEADARRQLVLLEAREESRRQLIEELAVADVRAREYRSQLERLQQREKAEAGVRRWTAICRRVREALHTSALPSLIMRAYARLLNERLAYYLHTWEAPFRLWLDEERLEFTAEKEEGHTVPAERLSGGEEIVGASSYRLGMTDTFARQVGLLVLDEPTNHLDKTNIVHLQRLLLRLKELSGATGRQIIIVTHEESLMGFFDHSIILPQGTVSR